MVDFAAPSYDLTLVSLSVVLVWIAAYATLTLTAQTGAPSPRRTALAGLLMGGGIWAMHFTGMLALNAGVPVSYHAPTVAASAAAPILTSALGLHAALRLRAGLLMGGLLLGTGVAVMHYLGMHAMRLPATVTHDPAHVLASLAIAAGAATTALHIIRRAPRLSLNARFAGALLLAAAASGMHYVAMSGAHIAPHHPHLPVTPDNRALIWSILTAVIPLCSAGMWALHADRQLKLQAARTRQAEQLNHELERRVAERTAELHHANEQLRRVNADLSRSNADLERFAHAAAHDLQEPLRTIASFTDLLVARTQSDDPRTRAYATHITGGVDRMKRLIDDLLTYARLTQTPGEPAPVCTHTLLSSSLHDLRGTIEGTGAQIHTGTMPVVHGDPQQLQALFTNLLSNAVQYGRPGVRPHVQVSAERRGDHWEFQVNDNGVGIEAQYFDRIFQAFQRLHPRDHSAGTGTGLALVKRIIETHGGTIWLRSTPGVGSAFHFTLPAHTDPT